MIGTPPPRDRYQKAPPMDVDGESDEPWDVRGGEDVEERLMLLVSEDELEGASSSIRHPALTLANNLTWDRFEISVLHHRRHRCLQPVRSLSHSALSIHLHPRQPLMGSFCADRTPIWHAKNRTGSGSSMPTIRRGNWPRKSVGLSVPM